MNQILSKILAGQQLTPEEATEILKNMPSEELYSLADQVRKHFCGDDFHYCSIVNARSGRCSENCKWCAQSSFHKCDVEHYDVVETDFATKLATENYEAGVHRFSLVTSGRTISEKDLDKFLNIYKSIAEKSNIILCASMGLLTCEQMKQLKDVGVERYHCNIETAPSFFENLCTTHRFEDKIQTLENARKAGLSLCSGVIIGMGETLEHRVEMATFLRDFGVKSIPINVLMPIKGTKLENQPILDDETIFRTFAMFRLVNPDAEIRMAGGRAYFYKHQDIALHAGINACIVGNMLTTEGPKTVKEDINELRY